MMNEESKPIYDFDFLCRALNLLPYNGIENHAPFNQVRGAVNITAITNLRLEYNNAVITLFGGEKIVMNEENLVELEALIKRRQKEQQEAQAAAIKRESEMRVQAELEAAHRAMANAAIMKNPQGRGFKRN